MKTRSVLRYRPMVERLESREVPALLAPMTSQGGGIRIAAGDFDNDGRDDVAVLQGSILSSQVVESGGTNDVVALDTKTNATIRLSKGDGTFRKSINLKGAVGSHIELFEVSDRNGDGNLDIAIRTATDNGGHTNQGGYWNTVTTRLNVWLGKGDGTFGNVKVTVEPIYIGFGLFNSQSVSADFNRDGIADRATVNGSSNVVIVSLGNANGTYQSPRTFPAGASPGTIAVGDFNGDGWIDVVVGNNVPANSLTLLFNDGKW